LAKEREIAERSKPATAGNKEATFMVPGLGRMTSDEFMRMSRLPTEQQGGAIVDIPGMGKMTVDEYMRRTDPGPRVNPRRDKHRENGAEGSGAWPYAQFGLSTSLTVVEQLGLRRINEYRNVWTQVPGTFNAIRPIARTVKGAKIGGGVLDMATGGYEVATADSKSDVGHGALSFGLGVGSLAGVVAWPATLTYGAMDLLVQHEYGDYVIQTGPSKGQKVDGGWEGLFGMKKDIYENQISKIQRDLKIDRQEAQNYWFSTHVK
jgi:hypothetical protein